MTDTIGTKLERDYRAAIGWYPTRWRRRHGESMVGTLLDVADEEGRDRANPGELADLRWRGVVERANVLLPEPVRSLAASISTGAAAGFALVYFVFVCWAPWATGDATAADVPTFGPFWNAGVLLAVPMVLAALAASAGWRAGAHLAGVLAVLGIVAARQVVQATENWNGPGSTTLAAALALVLAANVGDPRRRVALGAGAAVVGIGLTVFAVLRLPTGNPFEFGLLGDGGWWGSVASPWMLAAAGLLCAVLIVVLVLRRHVVVAAAIAMAWMPWAVAATITLRWFANEPTDAVVTALGSIVLALWTLGLARRAARRHPEHV